MEYASSLYLKSNDEKKKVDILPDLKRKINILTLKFRPICSSTGCVVGFKWFENGSLQLSEQAFLAGNFPKDQKFEPKCLSSDIWDQLERDLCEDNQIMAQSRGESNLPKEDQLKILRIVSTEGPDW